MSSPSSSKVDDFLSSLSSLSQQRLSEDSQRQRRLQRSIDELRRCSGSTSPVRHPPKPQKPLHLAGSAPSLREETPPPMPPRPADEAAPPMPPRPADEAAPPMPPRSIDETPPPRPPRPVVPGVSRPEINLVSPVARPPPRRDADHSNTASSMSRDRPLRSFSEIESVIKGAKEKPAVPSKPVTSQCAGTAGEQPRAPVRPQRESNEVTAQIAKLRKSPTKRESPSSTPASAHDAEARVISPKLKNERPNLARLPPPKPVRLKDQASTSTQADPKPEGLTALGRLKRTQPPPRPVPPKPEALQKLDSLKPPNLQPNRKTSQDAPARETEVLAPGTGFTAQLSSILRSNTLPAGSSTNAGTKAAVPQRAATTSFERNTGATPLVHASKARSKGPKRRLPTSMQHPPNRESGPSALAPTAAPCAAARSTGITVVKRTPPPVNREGKRNALESLRPSRNISGEIFI
ncbi:hypothetical protein ABC855_g3570 [[Candida] zeylanoides]